MIGLIIVTVQVTFEVPLPFVIKHYTMSNSGKQVFKNENKPHIFERMKAGELFRLDDPEYPKVLDVVPDNKTICRIKYINERGRNTGKIERDYRYSNR